MADTAHNNLGNPESPLPLAEREPTRAESARRGWEAARRRSFPITTLGVGLLALAVGVAGTLLTVRYLPGPVAAGGTVPVSTATSEHAQHGAPTPDARPASDPGPGASQAVYVSSARQQLIGVRTAALEHRALDTTIRTVGTIAYDETRVTQIHTKIAGWVERVYVDYVGKSVRRGQPLFTIYSPELVATQAEYLLALKAQRQLGESAFAETRAGAESLLASTRARLRLWDITEAQIDELERTGQARRTLTLYSPFNGVVLERNVFAGQYITPETNTFKISDLSTIWVLGQMFEYETRVAHIGQDAEIEFPYAQSLRRLKGKITFIYPEVDPQTRRVKVRIEFPNPGLELKPETYVTVLVRVSGGHQLAIPKEAVIDTGEKRYALVALPNGYFEPRAIEVGEPVDQFYPVLNGLGVGDTVVTSAQFLIDSETNLQAAMQSMVGHGHAGGGASGGTDETKGTGMPPTNPRPDHSRHKQ